MLLGEWGGGGNNPTACSLVSIYKVRTGTFFIFRPTVQDIRNGISSCGQRSDIPSCWHSSQLIYMYSILFRRLHSCHTWTRPGGGGGWSRLLDWQFQVFRNIRTFIQMYRKYILFTFCKNWSRTFFFLICFWWNRNSYCLYSPLRPSEDSLQGNTIPDGSPSKDWQSTVGWIRTQDCSFTIWCCYQWATTAP